jgi:hypothetical protein
MCVYPTELSVMGECRPNCGVLFDHIRNYFTLYKIYCIESSAKEKRRKYPVYIVELGYVFSCALLCYNRNRRSGILGFLISDWSISTS